MIPEQIQAIRVRLGEGLRVIRLSPVWNGPEDELLDALMYYVERAMLATKTEGA